MTTPSLCRGCGAARVEVLLDFGPQPPSNRFERAGAPERATHPLVVGQCVGCGLYQLADPMSPAMVKSRFEWLTYNEPEGHLDDLVARLCQLPGVVRESRVVGLTYKDDTTLARFKRLGHADTFRYDAAADFGIGDRYAGLESIQSALDEPRASRLAARHGQADLLVMRHVLEHAHDPAAFLRAATTLVKPGGYLVFEMPDCTKFVQACDYSFIWEEHIAYFSTRTLAAFVESAGLAMRQTALYPYPLEDSLVGIVQNRAQENAPRPADGELGTTLADGRTFARRYSELRARLHSLFGAWRNERKRVALFGAGHLAAKFVNLFSLGSYIDCVIDDNPHKQALLMPGSRLPIHGSPALESRAIDLCLLSLSPESEQKVRANSRPYLERGGRFLSIFSLNPQSVYAAGTP